MVFVHHTQEMDRRKGGQEMQTSRVLMRDDELLTLIAWVDGGYVAGSQVSKTMPLHFLITRRYECRQGTESGYCNQPEFEPGMAYSFMA